MLLSPFASAVGSSWRLCTLVPPPTVKCGPDSSRRSLRNALQEEQVALAEIQRAAASVPRLERATRRLDCPAGELTAMVVSFVG